MIRDINNMGYKDVKVQITSDQEFAIVAVQEYIRLNRSSPTILTNRPVGESECNGRAEGAMRRVKEKAKTLIAQFEEGVNEKLKKGSDVLPWLVRWSGELLSQCAPGYDGNTQYERLRGERCTVTLAMFGEIVLYLSLKIAKSLKEQAQPKMKLGIWLGVIEGTQEIIIGTCRRGFPARYLPNIFSRHQSPWLGFAIAFASSLTANEISALSGEIEFARATKGPVL